MSRNALIIGISGQDGAYLARLLLAKGYTVHGTSRDREAAAAGNLARLGVAGRVSLHTMSLADFRSVFTTLQTVRPDEIYNLGGQTSVGLSFEMPVETFESIAVGTLNILECLRILQMPVRLYNATSSECFGNTPEPADESTPFHPRSPYAMAKAAAFWSVANYREAYGLHASSGILFNHESPIRPARFVSRKIVAAAVRISEGSAERLKLGNIGIRRDWGWAPEYVEAMWRMLQESKADDYVIATGQTHSLADFVALIFERFGLDWRAHVDIDETLFRPSEIDVSVGSPRKAERELGWRAQLALPDIVDRLIEAERGGVV